MICASLITAYNGDQLQLTSPTHELCQPLHRCQLSAPATYRKCAAVHALSSKISRSRSFETCCHLAMCHGRILPPQEEGIVLKAPSSSWQPNDRSGAWLKLKPDYIKV